MSTAAAPNCQLPAPPPSSCGVTFTAVPAAYHCATNCDYGPPQQAPITVTFSQPIYQLIVFTSGALSCSGMYGKVTAYNRTYWGNNSGGQQVEQRDFVLYDPGDCGVDNVTCCTVDTLQFPGGVSKVVIEPPQPWTFPVPVGDTVYTGHVQLGYFYWFDAQRPSTAPCPTGDELLDQQAMRNFLSAAWDSSKVNEAQANRRETPGYLLEDSTGNLGYRLYQNPATDTPCNSSLPLLSALPDIPLASGHTHPFAPRDTVFPPVCGYTTPRQYDTTTYGGASDLDIRALVGDSLPFYILDKRNIYAYPASGVTLVNANSMVRVYPRVDPKAGCTRL